MSFKEAIRQQIIEYINVYKEMVRNPWFWVFYIIAVILLNYFDVK